MTEVMFEAAKHDGTSIVEVLQNCVIFKDQTYYNITGKEITTLVNEKKSSGNYEVTFNGSNLSSGIYFYSLFADGAIIDTKKAILLK